MEPKTLTVILSKDNSEFSIPRSILEMSTTLKELVEDTSATVIPVDNIDSKVFGQILEYITYHAENPGQDSTEEPSPNKKYKEWDARYISKPQTGTELLDLINAANYLAIKGLVYLGCYEAAKRIKGKKVEEMREFFNVKCDFTPSEEESIMKELNWLEEK